MTRKRPPKRGRATPSPLRSLAPTPTEPRWPSSQSPGTHSRARWPGCGASSRSRTPRPHDFRRTGATNLTGERIGIPRFIVSRVLNQISDTGRCGGGDRRLRPQRISRRETPCARCLGGAAGADRLRRCPIIKCGGATYRPEWCQAMTSGRHDYFEDAEWHSTQVKAWIAFRDPEAVRGAPHPVTFDEKRPLDRAYEQVRAYLIWRRLPIRRALPKLPDEPLDPSPAFTDTAIAFWDKQWKRLDKEQRERIRKWTTKRIRTALCRFEKALEVGRLRPNENGTV